VSAVLAFDNPAVAAESGGAVSARPNLLLIVMDTVRADHLSVQGYSRDTTPHLKGLAEDSVSYVNAFAASDITLTSHASIFTACIRAGTALTRSVPRRRSAASSRRNIRPWRNC